VEIWLCPSAMLELLSEHESKTARKDLGYNSDLLCYKGVIFHNCQEDTIKHERRS